MNNDLQDDLHLLQRTLYKNIYKILLGTILSTCIATYIAHSTPNKYTSSVLLAPVDNSSIDSLSNQVSSFGLGSLIGMNSPTSSKTNLAVEILKSRSFISDFITKRGVLVPLFETKKWDPVTNKLILDEKIYSEELSKWVRDVEPPYEATPSMQEAHRIFINDHMNVSFDSQKQFVEIYITHFSPELSQKWLFWIVEDLNNKLMEKDINQSERAIKYLESKVASTSSEEMKSLLYNLIQQQIKIIMLAYTNKYYALEIIDPPVIPEKKSSPYRLIMIIVGTFLGFIATFFLYLIFDIFRSKN